jgi:hypothetical protein
MSKATEGVGGECREPILPAFFPPKARREPALGYKKAGKIGKKQQEENQIIIYGGIYTLF